MNTGNMLNRYASAVKFLCVGVAASVTHASISWVFYYHIWPGWTLLSTFVGYSGGWFVSYYGNRAWSFRAQTQDMPIVSSALRFIVGQLVAMCVLLSFTWGMQMLIILYFHWYIITNGLQLSSELEAFCRGASYPPALFIGMGIAAICSYFIMKKFVFCSISNCITK